jgi:hypothetical protein
MDELAVGKITRVEPNGIINRWFYPIRLLQTFRPITQFGLHQISSFYNDIRDPREVWLTDNNIPYKMSSEIILLDLNRAGPRTFVLWIDFKNGGHAVMYKLRWADSGTVPGI